MSESLWHKQVRSEYFDYFKPNAYSSHTNISKLELYCGEKKRENCLSDVDIVVLDSTKENITQLIEIETAMNLKKLIGIVLATHFCDSCRLPGSQKTLKNITLKIVCKKGKDNSKKPLKLKVIKKALDDILSKIPGSLSGFCFEERP